MTDDHLGLLPHGYPGLLRRLVRRPLARRHDPGRQPLWQRAYRVALGRQAVDGLVFWSRNPLPFRPVLDALHAENVPFVLQLTVTGYPRTLDRRTPGSETLIEAIRGLRDSFGARAVVWRYDPILISSMTDATWHLRNFTDLARALAGVTDEVTVSFAHIYAKSARTWPRRRRSKASPGATPHGRKSRCCTMPWRRSPPATACA